jgi:hypothetical protein
VYENNVLQFVPTAEGRMVNSVEKGLLYQYHYKDHLGNVRMTFAPDVRIKETLRLTAEADSVEQESQDFSNLVVSRTAEDASEGWYSVALAKSKGSISSRVLKVQKGGSLSLSARATYDQEKIATLAEGNTPANRWGSVAVAAGGSIHTYLIFLQHL